MTSYLCSGGAGFLGSHLCRELVEKGHSVKVIDDLSSGSASVDNFGSLKPKIDITIDTIVHYQKVLELSKGVDTIIHLATQCLVKGMDDPALMHQVNDIGTFNICMAAKENGCKLTYMSTSEVYGIQHRFPIKESATLRPQSLYALTKIVGEKYTKFFHDTYDVPAVIVRGFNFFGPLQREDLDMARMMMGYNAYAGVITAFIKRWEAGLPPVIFGDGRQSRDWSYVTDIVDGVIALSDKLKNCETVNLGSGEECSVLELVKIMGKYWDRDYEPIIGPPRINDIGRLLADTTYAKSLIGWKPKVNFRTGLRRYIDWYRGKQEAKK